MTKAEVISTYDVATLIQLPPGASNISTIFVDGGMLKATTANGDTIT